MMQVSFEKYQGTGNDFIIIDIRNHAIPEKHDIIAQLCDRHFGIGADGLILLEDSLHHDFMMRYFNADGRESSMCGNGGRCIVAFAKRLGIIDDEASFEAADGIHHAVILEDNDDEYVVKLGMTDTAMSEWQNDEVILNTGSPHLVKMCTGLYETDVANEGRRLRRLPQFGHEGINVNFMEVIGGLVNVRTYERGVEAETLSCGTGTTAAALAWALKSGAESPISLRNPGGVLNVYFTRNDDMFSEIFLEGPATFVFSGEINIMER